MAASAQSLQDSSASVWLRLWRSSLGKKYVMALTGLGLYAFVIIHLLGNLQVFLGPSRINDYAHTLKSTPVVLWGGRIGLLTIAVLHITAALQLALANRRARPVGYAVGKPVASTFAQRTLVAGGLVILAFILFHLAHFTLGFVDAQYLGWRDAAGRHDVRRMMIAGFANPLIALFYLVAMGALLLHLSHGVSSAFQSLGLRNQQIFGVFDKLARGSALVIFLGNAAILLAILAGLIQ
jgi:succinate dehydrogenase / fumarate reductase cytochrome b subunit